MKKQILITSQNIYMPPATPLSTISVCARERGKSSVVIRKALRFWVSLFAILINTRQPQEKNDPSVYPIRIEAEYSEQEGTLSMNITWGGEAYNPISDGDALSSTIVTKLTRDIRYSRDDKNHLHVLL